jgi:aryl-phospho-beta-D-glucosidase BglC (GH1 family)
VAEAQVQAIHDSWNANTVRLQIAQDELTGADGSCKLTPGSSCLAYYQEIQTVVNYALQLQPLPPSNQFTVVINDTTEAAPGFTANEPLPTRATEVFWKDIAAKYAGNPRVIFDLFNEPRGLGGTGATQWQGWRNGATLNGVSYLGMQTVLSYVRNKLQAPNMVWADGLDAAGTLNGIAAHDASGTVDGAPGSVGTYALSQSGDAVTGPLVYTFHHPMGDQTGTAWWRDFGYLPALGYSVMDGEWNNAVDGSDYCWSDAPTSIPAYQSYLAGQAGQQIGLTGWELGPNINSAGVVTWSQSAPFDYTNPTLAASPSSYETPTTLSGDPSLTWDCNNTNDAGSGQSLHDWFGTQGG